MNNAPTTPLPSRTRRWILAARPRTLTGAVAPVALGTACAAAVGRFTPGPAVAALVVGVMIQVGTNLANDVYDFEKGADDGDRAGPLRMTQAGLLTPIQVRGGMWLSFAVAMAAGLYLAAQASVRAGSWGPGTVLVGLGVASIAAGIGYTAGPFPLGYHGLGDLFVMIFFGFVAVAGTMYVQALEVSRTCWWASLSMGAMTTALLVVNNVRDRATDLRAGKRTIPVRFGRTAGLAEYAVLLVTGYAVPIGLAATGTESAWVLISLASVPLGLVLMRQLATSPEGPVLNRVLVGTARLMLVYGILLAIGILLGKAATSR